MTLEEFLTGVGLLVISVTPLAWGAVRLRRRLLPRYSGAASRLVELVLALATLLTVGELLGAIGLFRRGPLLLAYVVAGGAMAAGGTGRAPKERQSVPRPPTILIAVAVAVSALVIGQWSVRTADSISHGIKNQDSITYHLPHAARFMQAGWTTRLHWVNTDWPDTFHPSNTEVLHAYGMVMFRRDVLSPFMNLGWLIAMLLAAWCVGRPSGRGPLTLTAATLIVGSPLMSLQNAGAASNDIAVLFFLLAIVAFLADPERGKAVTIMAAVAAGLAMGTKLTAVVPVVTLTAGLFVVERRGARRALVASWLVPLVLVGGFWYARNLVRVGSPVPAISLGAFKSPHFQIVDRFGYSVSDYFFDGQIWKHWFIPGLSADFGRAWWLTFGLVAIGAGLALFLGRQRHLRVLGAVVVVSAVAWALTPSTALGVRGHPLLFTGNVVYLTPALVLGLVLLPLVPALQSRGRAALLVVVASIALLISQLSTAIPAWPRAFRTVGFATTAAILVAAGAAALAWRLRERVRLPSMDSAVGAATVAGVLTAIVLAGVGGSFHLASTYLDNRYMGDAVSRWARSVDHQRIAIAGFSEQYPLYAPTLSNYVQLVGHHGPHGEFTSARSCPEWRHELRVGRYAYVVLEPKRMLTDVLHREIPWTTSDPASTVLLRSGDDVVFRFDPSVPDPGCSL